MELSQPRLQWQSAERDYDELDLSGPIGFFLMINFIVNWLFSKSLINISSNVLSKSKKLPVSNQYF